MDLYFSTLEKMNLNVNRLFENKLKIFSKKFNNNLTRLKTLVSNYK
jgi:hypothetical protein